MAIADGVYEILPLLNVGMALDVYGNSVANKANVRIWSRNGTNGQKWTIATTGGITTIRDAETGRSLDVAGAVQANGRNVWMYTYNGTSAQRFVLTEYGTQAVNGTAYPVVRIGAFGANTYVLDVAGGKSSINTNVQIYTSNATNAQRFVLIPTEWLAISGKTTATGLPTPSAGAVGTTRGTALAPVTPIDSDTVYPAWKCPETYYQVRYRTRTRDAGEDWLDDWSDWKSIADGSTAWDGYGAPGASNCTPTLIGKRQWSTNGVAVDNSSTYDRTDIEITARPWRASWGSVPGSSAHGPSYTYSVITARAVTISAMGVLLSPDGITCTWTSNCTHDGNSVTLKADAWGVYTTTGSASGSVTIPQYLVSDMPDSGDSVTVTMTMTTVDGLEVTKTSTVTVSYESNHGTSLTLSATTSGTIATVTASDASAQAWLIIDEGHGTRYVPLDGSSPWTVAPPLGIPWKVLASVTNAGTWASVIKTFVPIVDGGWHVTSQDLSRDLVILWGEGESPKADPSYSRSVDEVEVLGRERPVYVPQDATETSWTVEGVTYGKWIDQDVALADWAVHAGHVIFRSPQGWWTQACVTGGSIEQTRRDVRSIKLSMKGETW